VNGFTPMDAGIVVVVAGTVVVVVLSAALSWLGPWWSWFETMSSWWWSTWPQTTHLLCRPRRLASRESSGAEGTECHVAKSSSSNASPEHEKETRRLLPLRVHIEPAKSEDENANVWKREGADPRLRIREGGCIRLATATPSHASRRGRRRLHTHRPRDVENL